MSTKHWALIGTAVMAALVLYYLFADKALGWLKTKLG